ncbi:carboxyltransferase domain-containing protein [Streptomyces sp. TRM49041]|uniref:carboxyltransferase domain-containing protein n=1 Tax=Streptomyces sp. TRM49041 TaxID=2603216 RepID=UPI0011EF6E12
MSTPLVGSFNDPLPCPTSHGSTLRGRYTGVYPRSSPDGWRLIGWRCCRRGRWRRAAHADHACVGAVRTGGVTWGPGRGRGRGPGVGGPEPHAPGRTAPLAHPSAGGGP